MSSKLFVRGPFAWASEAEYSQAVVSNGLIFVSGQYGADAKGNVVSQDFEAQARATFTNLQSVLAEASADLGDVLQLRCFLLRVDDYPVFRQIRREYLAEPYPASSVTCAPQFAFPGMLIEIEAVASLPTRTP